MIKSNITYFTHKSFFVYFLLCMWLFPSIQAKDYQSYTPKKIVNEFIYQALAQHYEDIKTYNKCDKYKFLIFSYNKKDNEAFKLVADFIFGLQSILLEKSYSLIKMQLKSNSQHEFIKKYLSYPIKAFYLCNEISKQKKRISFIF